MTVGHTDRHALLNKNKMKYENLVVFNHVSNRKFFLRLKYSKLIIGNLVKTSIPK